VSRPVQRRASIPVHRIRVDAQLEAQLHGLDVVWPDRS
jgi:hypothetical protein